MADPQKALLKLIQEAQGSLADDGTITTRELQKLLGCGGDKARSVIEDLVEAGKMEAIMSPRKSKITGVVAKNWAYRIVK